MVFENRKELQRNSATDEELEKIFESKRKQDFKLIYCSLSTMNKSDDDFVKRLIEAVSRNKNWKMIIGLGGISDNKFSEDLPENIYTFEWIPQLEVLKNADCSINHGGIHTINECLYFGVPMVIYSGKQYDQNGCAARVSFHKLGIMADKDTDDVAEIETKITQIFEDSGYFEKVMEFRLARAKNENRLVQIIENLLKSEEQKKL
jgi:UDP:flavonoid glycosyltransferase YjiC (YdhE family)